MSRDIDYVPKKIATKCDFCNEYFNLYEIQKLPINICKECSSENKNVTLVSINQIVMEIIQIAEKNKKILDEKIVIDVEELITTLQNKEYPA